MIGKKTGGRRKGTVNKKSLWLRETLINSDIDWADYFKKALDTKDEITLQALLSLLPYLNPKMKERDADAEVEAEESPEPADILSLIK